MRSLLVRAIAFGSFLTAALVVARAPAEEPVPADALAKIQAAAPDKATAKPAQPRKLLVYTGCKGFVHSSIPYVAAAIQEIGRKTGAFEVVASADPAVFKPESLQGFAGICLNNTTGELFDDPALKASLLQFVKDGKGLIGIHAATDCFGNWPEYGALLGGYFDGHPWTEKVGVKLDDPTHPVNAAFDGKGFEVDDEIYQFKAPYARDKLHVLLSLDPSKTDVKKGGRQDGDYAVSWVRTYGLGRVFYCSLGHREEILWNAAVLRHYLAGIQFALGDLPGDATPSAQLGKDGWVDLFNGKDLTGWITGPGAWIVQDGVLARAGEGGDIWSEQVFGDFILDLEFKFGPGANSGVFFRTANIQDCVQTGIEVQVLDTADKAELGKHDCGAIYDCLAPSKNAVKKAGEWNHIALTCRGSKITVVMNGTPIVDMDLDKWTEPHKNPDGTANKFDTAYKDMPRSGHIGFQNYGNPVWYRNVRVKRLGP